MTPQERQAWAALVADLGRDEAEHLLHERAAIMEYDGELPRAQAEREARALVLAPYMPQEQAPTQEAPVEAPQDRPAQEDPPPRTYSRKLPPVGGGRQALLWERKG